MLAERLLYRGASLLAVTFYIFHGFSNEWLYLRPFRVVQERHYLFAAPAVMAFGHTMRALCRLTVELSGARAAV
jgi:hypothetical protein